jgi:hypothetical protein
MTRSHRSAHHVIWIVMALAMGVGLAAALLQRAPAHASAVFIGEPRR